jgi:putative DNA primase/helicase
MQPKKNDSRRARMQPKKNDSTWGVVPNAWGGIIAPPGFMKSPVLKAAAQPLYYIEGLWRKRFKAASELHRAEKEAADLRLAAWKSTTKANLKKGLPVPTRPASAPPEPAQQRLITGDATFEKLHELMMQNPAGLFVVRDELTGWLAQLERDGREGEREFYLESWNGDTGHSIDRIGRGSLYVPACCVSMLGGITPGRLRSYLADALKDGPSNDGLIQRFQLLVWPDTTANWRYVDRLPAADRLSELFERLTSLNGDNPVLYMFDEASQDLFVDWLSRLEARLRGNTLHSALVSYLGKFRKTIPSLALLFALADNWEPPVREGHTQQAIAWAPYLESHAQRVYSCVVSPRMQAAADLAKKIRDGSVGAEGPFAKRDVYRHHWTGLDNPDNTGDALEILRDAGWVRPVSGSGGMGRPPDLWEVNPRVRAH